MAKYIDANDIIDKQREKEMQEDTKNCMMEEHNRNGFYERHLGDLSVDIEYSPKTKKPYQIINKGIQTCKHPACNVQFQPKSSNNVYCCCGCRIDANKNRRKRKR